jgi:hypothetical protein
MVSTRTGNARKHGAAGYVASAVSVITPSLPERATMLAEAIRSVQAQTVLPAAHLIEVDYARKGPGPVINRLTARARTEWVAILADDDLFHPDHLEVLLAHSADADIVLSWSRLEGRPDPQYRGEFFPMDLLERRDTGMRGTFMFRRKLWDKLGGWPAGPIDDWQFLVNAIKARARLVPVYQETFTYRFHGGNLSDLLSTGADPLVDDDARTRPHGVPGAGDELRGPPEADRR